MNITDTRIRRIKDGGRIETIASVAFDGDFVVHDMKVIEGTDGLFLAMSSCRIPSGSLRDITRLINSKIRSELGEVVINEFHKVVAKEDAAEEVSSVENGTDTQEMD